MRHVAAAKEQTQMQPPWTQPDSNQSSDPVSIPEPAKTSDNLSGSQRALLYRLSERFTPRHFAKSLVVAAGISQKELAHQIGCPISEVSRVLLGSRRTRHIRAAIAEALGCSVADIWPET